MVSLTSLYKFSCLNRLTINWKICPFRYNYRYCLRLFAVDITVYHRGFHGDLNETFLVGEVNDVSKKLTKVTWECLQKAIDIGKCSPPQFLVLFVIYLSIRDVS